jgi:hypothetical protein
LPHVIGSITPAEIVGIFKSEDEAQVEQQLRTLILAKNLEVQSNDDVQNEPSEV